MHTRHDLALQSCLDLAIQMLAIRRDLDELTAQVKQMRTSKTNAPTSLRRAIGLPTIWGRFLATKEGQVLIAIVTPAVAAAVK